MAKYRKPVVIDARQWDGTSRGAERIASWMGRASGYVGVHGTPHIIIRTLEGEHIASPGDWIIRGVKGEFYPCRDDIFRATYDEAPDDAA
jgi:hypothetical protein